MRSSAAILITLAACTTDAPERPAWPTLPAAVVESSGLARGSSLGVLWTHGDSGTPPALHAITASGRLLRTVPVEGATAVDWEDIASDGAGGLWIADVGNNLNRRRDLALFHVPEPDPFGDGPAVVDRVLQFAYPEQTAFPPAALHFDAEALFVDDGVLWLLTKHRGDPSTALYRLDDRGDGTADAVRVATRGVGGEGHPFGGMVTGADLHAGGGWLAVLTYHAVLVFRRPSSPDAHWLSDLAATVPLGPALGQCEAIAWDGDGLVIMNEDGVVFRLDDPLAPRTVFPP